MNDPVEEFAQALSLFVALAAHRLAHSPTAIVSMDEMDAYTKMREAFRSAVAFEAVKQR